MASAHSQSPKVWHFEMIDTMTDQPFKGNPTPVFILDEYHQNQYFVEWPRDDVLQKVANEMNQSETIFILGNGDNDATEYLIRSFTPSKEEPFCGHGIVAAAHLLYRSVSQCSGWIMRFVTVGGITVDAQLERTDPDKGFEFGEARIIKLEIPAEPVKEWLDKDGVLRERIARSLGISASDILALGRNALMDLVIEVSDEVDMSAANMHIDAVDLMNASPAGTRSQIITSRGDACGVDFAKRVFAYGSEDQGTGSTYCVLIPYWAPKLGKSSMTAKQVSERTAAARVLSTATRQGYVTLFGSGIRVTEGQMLVPSSTM